MLEREIHPVLDPKEMADILEFREQLAYKTPEETDEMFYQWAVTGMLSHREHRLLAIYIYSQVS